MSNLFFDKAEDFRRHRVHVHQEVDKVAVATIGRDPARGRVGLDQVAEVSQIGQLVPNRGRAEVDEVPAGQGLGADRDGAGRELFDDRLQDLLFSRFH